MNYIVASKRLNNFRMEKGIKKVIREKLLLAKTKLSLCYLQGLKLVQWTPASASGASVNSQQCSDEKSEFFRVLQKSSLSPWPTVTANSGLI
jgi:hypothetical protein